MTDTADHRPPLPELTNSQGGVLAGDILTRPYAFRCDYSDRSVITSGLGLIPVQLVLQQRYLTH